MEMIPEKMRGVWLLGHGDLKQLQYKDDIPVPKPAATDVLIKVGAAGVNNTDINTRVGWYSKSNNDSEDATWSGTPLALPRIQGIDVCGRIVAVGEKVNSDRIGERVLVEPCLLEAGGVELETPWFLGSECDGGFAEYTVVAARHAFAVQSSMTDIELASFPCSYSTAENMLTRAKVSEGQTILVTGASGGVGSAAIQLAKARGAKVIALTSSTKAEEILELGADKTVGREDNLIDKLGVNTLHAVLDLVGGDSWPQLLEVLKPKASYAVAGAVAGANVNLDLRTLYLKDLSFFGCTVLEPEVFPNLVKHIEQNNIKALVAETFPLEKMAYAQETFLAKKYIGKIVLTL